MKPIVIDNFIPEAYQQSILTLLTGPEFGWSFFDYSVSDMPLDAYYFTDFPTKEHMQFRHVFYRDDEEVSSFAKYIESLFISYQLHMDSEIKHKQRVKSNLLVKDSFGPHLQPPHVDGMIVRDGEYNSIGKKTLLYYVNDSDGDTVLYNEYFTGESIGKITVQQIVKPVRGRAIIFDSNQIHSGTNPELNNTRMVINCVFDA
jgi:hypothetical protein